MLISDVGIYFNIIKFPVFSYSNSHDNIKTSYYQVYLYLIILINLSFSEEAIKERKLKMTKYSTSF